MSEVITIAIPTSGTGGIDAARSAHFGHADSFTLVALSDGQVRSVSTMMNPPHEHGGCGQTVQLLAQQGVDLAIVVGMGRGPLSMMQTAGMLPLFDDVSPTPGAAVAAYLAGGLAPFGGDHVCAGH